MAYLDKLIMLVGKSLNTFVDARPAKIVAGLEAENTNRLLQLLALAAVERPDSSRCASTIAGCCEGKLWSPRIPSVWKYSPEVKRAAQCQRGSKKTIGFFCVYMMQPVPSLLTHLWAMQGRCGRVGVRRRFHEAKEFYRR